MVKNLLPRGILIVAVIVIAVLLAFPLQQKINLGLDLKGGMYLILRVDTTSLSPESKTDAVERALEVIRNRIDEFGVGEPVIQIQGVDQILVQLPGMTDRKRALDLIGRTALLEFKIVVSDPKILKSVSENEEGIEGYEFKTYEDKQILLKTEAEMTGEHLETANVRFDQSSFGQPIVSYEAERGWELSSLLK